MGDNIDDMDSIVSTMCNYQSIRGEPYWLCQRQDGVCAENYGCDVNANTNGDCSEWLTARTADGNSTTARQIAPCCAGSCCSRSVERCSTCCEGDTCQSCNCYDECVAYSTQQENVACDTGHRYEIELDFILDGVSYNVTHHDKCDLTSAGYEDTECMAKLQTKYTAADEPCYVDKRMLPECGAAGTTNTCVSYSGPEWNIGAWVGIVIGGLMMLVGMIGGCIACGGAHCLGDFFSNLGECFVFCCGMAGAVCAVFKAQTNISIEFYDDEFAAAQLEHEEKCAALQKQVDDEKKSQSTDGLIVTIEDSSGKQISLTAMGSHSVSMVCKQLSVSAFSFAQTEFPQGSSKTLGTMGVCNGAILNVTSLPADMPSQVTMQSQLQLELDRMREWDAPQREGYKYTKVSKSCCCLPCGSTETALDVNKRTKVQPTAPQPAQFRVEAHSQL